jgi:hypothetical protein
MPTLPGALSAWPSDSFAQTLKDELKALGSGALPLHAGLTEGGVIDDSALEVTVLNTTEDAQTLQAKVGCFFTEVVGGCNCHDDPYSRNAYCELSVHIDRETAAASFTALAD